MNAPKNSYIMPPRENVLPDGSVAFGSIEWTDNIFGVEKLTDLSDIDYTPLKTPKVWYIYLLAYIPNADKKFTFVPIKDPRNKS